jgi:hypothetical protein
MEQIGGGVTSRVLTSNDTCFNMAQVSGQAHLRESLVVMRSKQSFTAKEDMLCISRL